VRFVVDASIAVEVLLRTRTGEHVWPTIESATLFAPELLDAEVLAVLRRETLGGRLTEGRAEAALEDLRAWDVDRIAHRLLVGDAWRFRHNLTAYDALYVAAARACEATLLTADGPLARSSITGLVVHNIVIG
jgi:predicted nucleic acid-binding protein